MKISVITICYNSRLYIEHTIRSVIDQDYDNVEYIVIDGGSTDGTVEIIKRYDDQIDKWISEPDNGIADAMNKGIRLATGDYVIFIHSDDYFVDSTSLESAVGEIDGSYDMYIFQVISKFAEHESLSQNNDFGKLTNFKMGSCHQGHLVKRSLFDKSGFFDLKFKICMDYDFVLRSYRNGAKALSVDLPISVMRMTGISSRTDRAGLCERFSEEKMVHLKNCSSATMRLFYVFYWFCYPLYWRMKH